MCKRAKPVIMGFCTFIFEETMPDTTVITAIAKVMIAAAWADGEIDHEELNSIKDLLFYMPNTTAADYAQVEIYLATPIGEAERARLVAELSGVIRTDADKALVMNSLTALAQSDGEVGESEAAVLAEVQRAFDEGRSSSGQLGRLLRGAARRCATRRIARTTWTTSCATASITWCASAWAAKRSSSI